MTRGSTGYNTKHFTNWKLDKSSINIVPCPLCILVIGYNELYDNPILFRDHSFQSWCTKAKLILIVFSEVNRTWHTMKLFQLTAMLEKILSFSKCLLWRPNKANLRQISDKSHANLMQIICKWYANLMQI